MGASGALTALLVLTVITISGAQTQYLDIIQGLQQLFQPYQGNNFDANFNNGATRAPTHKQSNRQESKRKNVEQRHQMEERRTKKPPPVNQYDYVFATTEKPSPKTTKVVSSHSNNSRSFNNKNEYSNVLIGEYYNPYEVTTKVNKNNRAKAPTTTTESYFNYFDTNRGTTRNVFANNFNNARPVTENVFASVNQRDTFSANNQPKPANFGSTGGSSDFNNNFSGTTNNRAPSDRNRGTLNTDSNINFPSLPANNRQNNGWTDNNSGFNNFGSNTGFTNNRPTTNFGNTEFTNNRPNQNFGTSNFNNNNNQGTSNFNNNNRPTASNDNNRDTNGFNNNRPATNNFNNNRPATSNFNSNNWNNNNNFNQNFNDGFYFPPDNPLINRPGVQPALVDTGLPPITNRPVTNTNNFFNFNRPTETSSGTFTDSPSQEPEILIGPDEDDMTEWQKRRFAEKAERMCDYYKSLTIKKVVALPLIPSPDPVEFNVADCTPINVPLVIGGTVATIREFPHMALVGWMKVRDDGYSWKCGGSLISDRYVLTAGHCTYQDKDVNVISGPPQAVQLGSSYLDDRGALVVRISSVIRHPKYKMRRSYHDIALIKLVSKVKFSEVIRPACLGRPPPVGKSIIATGWGRTEFGGDHSSVLRSVSLNVWDMQECKDIWGTSLKLPNGVTSESHMCAGDRGGGHDTCQGDSGGPAQIQDGCLWRVVAVTSYGRSCGAPDTPALYAVIPHAFVAAQVFGDTS